MKCQYCGKDLTPGSKFCDGCGAKIEEQNHQVPMQNTPPNKSNTGLKVTIIILSVIIVAGIIFAIWFFLIRDDGSKESKDKENESSAKTTKKNTSDDDDDDDDEEDTKTNNKKNTSSSSHKLECSGEMFGSNYSVVIYYDKNDKRAESAEVEMVMDLDDFGYGLEGLGESDLEEMICENGETEYDECKVKIRGSKVIVNAKATNPNSLDDISGQSLEDARKEFEEQGLTCK